MTRHLALLVAGLVGVLVLAGHLARAAPPGKAVLPGKAAPNDSLPYWSWDARQLAFQRESPRADNGHVLFSAAGHGEETDVVGAGRARGWRPAGGELLVQSGGLTTVRDAADRQIGSVPGTDATWSPGGGQIAYLQGDALYVADATGASRTSSPKAARWSRTISSCCIASSVVIRMSTRSWGPPRSTRAGGSSSPIRSSIS